MNSKIMLSLAGVGLLLANFVLDSIKSKKEHEEIVNEAAELAYQKYQKMHEADTKEQESV